MLIKEDIHYQNNGKYCCYLLKYDTLIYNIFDLLPDAKIKTLQILYKLITKFLGT